VASSGVILKELLIKLGLDVDEAKFAKGQIAASVLEGVFKKVVSTVSDLGHAFVENLHSTIQYGDRIHKLSQQVGVGEETLQGLVYAGELADVEMDSMAQSAGFLAKNMMHAKKGSQEAATALKGIPFKDAEGNLLGVDEVMISVADRFKDMPDGAEKTALAMQLFGRAGKQMIPMLNEGSEKLREMQEEAKEMGLVMDSKATKASEEIEDNLKRLSSTTKGLWRSAIAPLLESINGLIVAFLRWRKQNAAQTMKLIHSVVSGLITGLKILGSLFDLLTQKQSLMVLGISGLVFAFNALSVASVKAGAAAMWAWIKAAAPFVAIAAVIGAILFLMEDLAVYQRGGHSLFGRFENHLKEWMKPKADDPWFVTMLKTFITVLKEATAFVDRFDKKTVGTMATVEKLLSYTPAGFIGSAIGDTLGKGVNKLRGADGTEARVPQLRTGADGTEARVPQLRTPAGGDTNKTSNSNTQNYVTIGPITQQPGQDGGDLAKQIADAAAGVMK
jgi:hypothetical protein